MVRSVVEKFPNIKVVGTTLREVVSGLINNWSAIMYYDGQFFESRRFENLEIEDRVGGGGGFCSGLIYGFLNGMTPQECVIWKLHTARCCRVHAATQAWLQWTK